jgi:hypothetical protein
VTAPGSIDPARFLHAVCGAPYGMPGPDRMDVRNGYRHQDFDTRPARWTSLDAVVEDFRTRPLHAGRRGLV